MPNDAQTLSDVIGVIYDAALDAELWPGALGQTCQYVGGAAANLIWSDSVSRAAGIFHSWGFDPEFQQSYFETYAPLNPLYPAGLFRPVGEVFSTVDLMPHEELWDTRFYREWIKPQGLLDFCNVNLENSATAASSFVVLRNEAHGIVDEEVKSRVHLLFPHLKRAVTIGRTLEFHKARSFSLSTVLDQVATPVVLTTGDGLVAHVNQAAEGLLSRADMLRVARRRIEAVKHDAEIALREAIRRLGAGDGGASVTLVDGDGRRHVASLLSLRGAVRGVSDAAEIAIFLRRETPAGPTPLEAIARTYRLTASEIRMLAAVAEGGTRAELANRLGIAVSTAKTHILHLYEKTGAKRQSDLVRLFAAQSTFMPSMEP